jgi:hypothetical protein
MGAGKDSEFNNEPTLLQKFGQGSLLHDFFSICAVECLKNFGLFRGLLQILEL